MTDENTDQIWKSLADPTRRALLDLLRERPRTTGELATLLGETTGLSRFAIMKHLGILEEANLVLVRAKGRERWHYLNAVPLRRVYERWVSNYADGWSAALLRLQSAVEATATQEGDKGPMNNSFEIEQEVEIGGEPGKVFQALTSNIGSWWSHTFSAEPVVIRLEPHIGGRFFEEEVGGGAGALYATVTRIKPGELLVLNGPMGMPGPVLGIIRFELEDRGGSTLLKLSHKAMGDVDEDKHNGYSAGWQQLLATHLKQFVEQGITVRPID